MFLYELAVELGEHSNDLADVATMLGVADAGPGSKLTPQQIAQIRAHFGAAGAAPLPPPPSLHTPEPPPPDASAPPTGPTAPATWGPPTQTPPSWGAPAEPPPSWGPPGTPTFHAPTDPPVGAPPPPPGPPGPVGGAAPRGRGWSKGQRAAVIGVGVVVAALFAFMVVNTGPDEARQEALDAREEELAANTTEWIPPETTTTTEAPIVTAAPMPRAAPGGISGGDPSSVAPDDRPPAPVDLTRFCSGVRAIMDLEVGVATAFLDGDMAAMTSVLAASRADWELGVEHMLAGASDRDRPLIEQYRANYLVMFGYIEQSQTPEQVTELLQANFTQEEVEVADPVNDTAAAYC